MWNFLNRLFSAHSPPEIQEPPIPWEKVAISLPEGPDAVVVDERPWIRAAWKEVALQQGKSIWILPFPQPLLVRLEGLPKQIPIYLGTTESEYGDACAVAQRLSIQGFFRVIVQVSKVFAGEATLMPHLVME